MSLAHPAQHLPPAPAARQATSRQAPHRAPAHQAPPPAKAAQSCPAKPSQAPQPHRARPIACFTCHAPGVHPHDAPAPAGDPAHRTTWQNLGPDLLTVGQGFLHFPAVAGTGLKALALGAGNMAEKYGDGIMEGTSYLAGDQAAKEGYDRAANRADAREKTAAQPLMDIFTAMTPGTLKDLTVASADAAGGQPDAGKKVLGAIIPNTEQAFHDDPAQTTLNGMIVLGGVGGALGKAGGLADAAGASRLGSGLGKAGEAARYASEGGPIGRGARAAGGRAASAAFGKLSPKTQAAALRAGAAFARHQERKAGVGGPSGPAGLSSSLALGRPYTARGLAARQGLGIGAKGLHILNEKQLALHHRLVKSTAAGGIVLKTGEMNFKDVAKLTEGDRP